MMKHKGKVLPHRFLLQQAWGPEYSEENDYLRVYMRRLRRKIEPNPSRPRYLVTELGIGYSFRSPPTHSSREGLASDVDCRSAVR